MTSLGCSRGCVRRGNRDREWEAAGSGDPCTGPVAPVHLGVRRIATRGLDGDYRP